MKIALMMENSQAAKNAVVRKELENVAQPLGHQVFNVGMSDEQDHHLTYIHQQGGRFCCRRLRYRAGRADLS